MDGGPWALCMLIDRQAAWDEIAAQLSEQTELAMDLESNSLHAYRERVCLIQLATDRECFVLDPLAVEDLSALGTILADPGITKDGHGCDYDVRSLDRDYGFGFRDLFDTQIAARFLGSNTPNLGSVLGDYLGVAIRKSKELQRSDWARRPLSASSLEYASNDVQHLVRLARTLRERLQELDRLDWVEEECERLSHTKYSPPVPEGLAFLRIKGADRLDERELAVLKEMHGWREELAERLDRPPFKVAANGDLLEAAQAAAWHGRGGDTLAAILDDTAPGLRRHLSGGGGSALILAARRGLESGPFVRPERPRRFNPWTSESRGLLQALKQRRTEIGEGLSVDPSLVWPAPSLERMALDPEQWLRETAENGATEVRNWQRREFAERWADVMETGKAASG